MIHAVVWYLLLLVVTAAALPLGWTWFRFLPDRGWGLLRALGLLLMGSVVWFVGSFGLWQLSPGSATGALLLIAGVGLWAVQRWEGFPALRAWLLAERRLIAAQELFFLVAFAFWVWFRIHDVEGIQYTERPMDFALLNAVLRGGEIPPNDPWLSGFSISYYYLGYLVVAQLAALGSVPSGIAYNLGFAMLAALTMGGALSLGYNLLRGLKLRRRDALVAGTLAPLLVALSSNLTGILTLAFHNRLLPDSVFTFFRVNDLTPDVASRGNLSGWWWWPASRTISDYGPGGGRIEIIDEFPFFSFMLGDMHPHVLALPFALLVVGIALNSVRGGLVARPVRLGRFLLPSESWGRASAWRLFFLLSATIAGAFAMLNTWDWPTALTLIAGGWLLALGLVPRDDGEDATRLATGWLASAGALLLGALLIYLPFYIGFSSQVDGIRLSVHHTYLPQYLLMFGLFWLVLLPLALTQLGAIRTWLGVSGGRGWLIAVALLLPVVAGPALQRWTMALTGALVALLLLALVARLRDDDHDPAGVLRFALALGAVGVGLTLVPEVVYLQDHFSNRMNTVFKLYYTAWGLLSLAATVGVVYLFQRLPTAIGFPWFLVFSLLAALTLWYPITTMSTKLDPAGPAHWDGRFWMAQSDPDRLAAIEWLDRLPGEVVIVERAGGAYQARESALSGFTGHSTLLGWQNHEGQWRGGNALFAERPAGIDEIYQTTDPARLRDLLLAWDVDYVAVTPLEQEHYNLSDAQLTKFNEVLSPVFQQGQVTIYGW